MNTKELSTFHKRINKMTLLAFAAIRDGYTGGFKPVALTYCPQEKKIMLVWSGGFHPCGFIEANQHQNSMTLGDAQTHCNPDTCVHSDRLRYYFPVLELFY